MQQKDITDQIQDLKNCFETLPETLDLKVSEALLKVGKIITGEQKKRISPKSLRLEKHITYGIGSNKEGRLFVICGYTSGALNKVPDAVVHEFGKPGKRRKKQTDSRGRKIGKQEPTPHIRPGFDAALPQANETLEKCLEDIKNEFLQNG